MQDARENGRSKRCLEQYFQCRRCIEDRHSC
jgi:hypothetical protein